MYACLIYIGAALTRILQTHALPSAVDGRGVAGEPWFVEARGAQRAVCPMEYFMELLEVVEFIRF